MNLKRELTRIKRQADKKSNPTGISNFPGALVSFAEELIILEDGSPIRFEDHQKRILSAAFTPDEVGRLPYKTVIYSAPKKSGKTAINAIVTLWFGYTIDPPNEILIAANDLEQSQGRVFRAARRIIEFNPILLSYTEKITANEILLKNRTTITALANDYAGAAGANQGLSSFDELWGYVSERSRRLYEELTPVPTRKNSIRFITTYAGFEGESELLEDLYKQGLKGKRIFDDLPVYVNGDLFMYWDHEPRMSWQTEKYYESQRSQPRPNTFLRLHCNQWVSGESSFFDMDRWDNCVDSQHKPPMPSNDIILYVGVDTSTKKDRAAVVTVYWDPLDSTKLCLSPKRFWQPTPDDPLDLEETLEKYLIELARNYPLGEILYDPFQFHRSATTLAKEGLMLTEFPQTIPNLTAMSQNLYDLIEFGKLKLYADRELRREATMAVGKETGRGLRIVKEKSTHKIDQIVAMAMACYSATRNPVVESIFEVQEPRELGVFEL
ncbi:MAG: terminase TerL endonuclease subunit [Ignavibacteriales bacterium]